MFNIAQCLYKVLDYKSWVHILNALQKISECIHRLEGETSNQNVQFHFGVVAKRISENMAKYAPKNRVSRITGKLSEEDKQPRESSEYSKSHSPSSPEEEQKETHIQPIHQFEINVVAQPSVSNAINTHGDKPNKAQVTGTKFANIHIL